MSQNRVTTYEVYVGHLDYSVTEVSNIMMLHVVTFWY